MNIQWTSHLSNSPEEKASLEEAIGNSSVVLTRLLHIIEEKERALYKNSISLSSYESPNWAFLRAHSDGRLQELSELKQLIKG